MAMDYQLVLSEVFVGSCPQSTEDVDLLTKKLGVSAVLNLQTDEDIQRLGCDWRRLESHYRKSKTLLRRIPVRDFDGDDLRRQLPTCVQTLNELLRKGHIVYLHCTSGIGRSPSVLVAYLNWVQQLDLDKALQVVMQCRACSPNLDAIRLASEDLLGDAA